LKLFKYLIEYFISDQAISVEFKKTCFNTRCSAADRKN
jgi:hypothetical protein